MEFISKPEWKLLDNEVYLTGCSYKSHISMRSHSYWLLERKNLLKFPDLKITSSEMIGNYECLIKEQEDQVVSSKSHTLDLKVMFPFIFIVQSVSEIFINNYQRLI